jgi:hypothetical protein
MRVLPLYRSTASTLSYALLNGSPDIEIGEVGTSGTVRKLTVRNRGSAALFIPDGSALVGGRQNRIVNLSVVLEPQTESHIPVSCVERRRWSPSSGLLEEESSLHGDMELRSFMCAGVPGDTHAREMTFASQGRVWNHVDHLLESVCMPSATAAYNAAFVKQQDALDYYRQRFPYPIGASGVLVEIRRSPVIVDFFDKPETLEKLWARLLTGYLVTAFRVMRRIRRLGSECVHLPPSGVGRFLTAAIEAQSRSWRISKRATSYRLRHPELVGAALFWRKALVHLSLFRIWKWQNEVRRTSSSWYPLET